MKAPEGFRFEREFLWPAEDRRCASYAFDSLDDLNVIYSYCKSFNVVVQAGGACGVWPRALGERFDRVYTFEPCPTNFRCLAANAHAENIFKFNAALGDERKLIEMVRDPQNVGAHYIDKGNGTVPTFLIDDLALDACDLLILDIEGYEWKALSGARKTLEQYRPTLVVEDRGYSERYGSPQGFIEQQLSGTYEVAARVHYDIILVPK